VVGGINEAERKMREEEEKERSKKRLK